MWGNAGRMHTTVLHCSQADTLETYVFYVCAADLTPVTILASVRSDGAKVERLVYGHFKWRHTLARTVLSPDSRTIMKIAGPNRNCMGVWYSSVFTSASWI
jgi:hypothetical protein